MRDIVATIQPDQDDIVRAPLAESICVQGAPGTGKTAVGLHRAAYLLYTHGGQLARSGVLVVGPNRAFLRYIEQVLPTLGEVDVDQTTVAGLTARVPVRAVDRPEVAVLKGDARMAEVLRRALWGEIAKPADSDPGAAGRAAVPGDRGAAQALRRRPAPPRPAPTTTSSCCTTPPAGSGWRCCVAEDARRQKEEAGGSPTRRRDAHGPRAAPRSAPSATRSGRPATRPGWSTTCGPTRRGSPARPAASWTTTSRRCCAGRWPAVGAHGALDRRRRGAGRRGGGADRSDRRLRARRPRRGAGPLAHAVPGGRAPAGRGLAHRAGRPRPGDQPVVAVGLAADAGGPGPAGHRRPPAHPRLPGARRGARLREPAAAAHRARPGGRHGGPLGAGLAERPAGVGAGRPARRGRRRNSGRRPARSGSSAPTPPSPRWPACWPRPGSPPRRSPTTAREVARSPSSRRSWPRDWSSTRSSWSTRPRSWPPSRAGCTGSTSSSRGR